MRALLVAFTLALPACGGPCQDDEPGLHFVLHTPVLSVAELSTTFSNGQSVSFNSFLASGYLDAGIFELTVAYPPEASNGPATTIFTTRPDPGWSGSAQVNIDLAHCTEIDLVAHENVDAGPRDASP